MRKVALLRVARAATALVAGETAPDLEDPLTGEPLALRRDGKRTVISATLPASLRDDARAPGLLSWSVPR